MHLHLNLQKAIQSNVHCSCTYTSRKQIQSYYIRIQTTSNVHCCIIIWDIKIQNLQLHLHFQKANSDCCTHCNCTYTSRKQIQLCYTRFLYVHVHVHVHIHAHVHGLNLTSHGFFRCGRSASTGSCHWHLGGGAHKLQKEGFHQID